MAPRLRWLILAVALLTLVAGLAVPFFQSLEMKSLRAEVRVMLNYMGTLQQAYHTDKGRYAFFMEPYGAPLHGKENCLRPLGADELGFQLKNCAKAPNAGGLRYYYQALKVEVPGEIDPLFLGRGSSGSDIAGENFICGDDKTSDVWEITASGRTRHIINCD